MPLTSNQKWFTSTSTQDVLYVASTASTIGTPYISTIDNARIINSSGGIRVSSTGGATRVISR